MWIKDSTCSRKTLRFMRILRRFYLDTYDMKSNIVAHPFTSDGWLQTIWTTNTMYRIWWFFRPQDLLCEDCWCKNCIYFSPTEDDRKRLPLVESKFDTWAWLYKITWSRELQVTMPCAWEYYLLYSKWPEEIESICDTIEIDDFMLSWLEFLIEWFYQREMGNINNVQTTAWDYSKRLVDAKKIQQNFIIYVGK